MNIENANSEDSKELVRIIDKHPRAWWWFDDQVICAERPSDVPFYINWNTDVFISIVQSIESDMNGNFLDFITENELEDLWNEWSSHER